MKKNSPRRRRFPGATVSRARARGGENLWPSLAVHRTPMDDDGSDGGRGSDRTRAHAISERFLWRLLSRSAARWIFSPFPPPPPPSTTTHTHTHHIVSRTDRRGARSAATGPVGGWNKTGIRKTLTSNKRYGSQILLWIIRGGARCKSREHRFVCTVAAMRTGVASPIISVVSYVIVSPTVIFSHAGFARSGPHDQGGAHPTRATTTPPSPRPIRRDRSPNPRPVFVSCFSLVAFGTAVDGFRCIAARRCTSVVVQLVITSVRDGL